MNLTTTYLGLTLDNPLVASAGPLSRTVDGVRQLADAGVGAIVLPSLSRSRFSGRPIRTRGRPERVPRASRNRSAI